MSKLAQEDIDLLYWHATAKMRQGSFRSAMQFFGYLFNDHINFNVGLALAYCAYRENEKNYAKDILNKITPVNPRETKLYERLRKRVEA
jgi:outer membrane protein assembly factor BamD (BamD/ComL family)